MLALDFFAAAMYNKMPLAPVIVFIHSVDLSAIHKDTKCGVKPS